VTDLPEIRLDPEQLERLAELVAENLRQRSTRLVTAREVAEHLSVDEGYVYEHAAELGVRRLGEGPKARLRFSLVEVDERLSACSVVRGSIVPESSAGAAIRRRRRRSLGTGVDLLPIRGVWSAR
jgi:hypothetical protein